MCSYFCIKFIDYMFGDKTLIDYTNLFSPHDFKKNDKVIKDIIITENLAYSQKILYNHRKSHNKFNIL